jgi:hypothetical protein
MKNGKWTALVLAILSIPAIPVSCRKNGVTWEGTLQEVDGVIIVKNPKMPMFGKDGCSIEEDLSIGSADKGEESAFSEITDVGIDEEENIYVLDRKEARIVVFNKAGGYLRTIGRKGQGPGEMQNPQNIYVTPRDEILVNDRGARCLHFFGRDGKHLRSQSLARMPSFHRPKVDSQNNIVARTMTVTTGTNTTGKVPFPFILAKFDADLNERFRIFSYEYFIIPNTLNVYPPECFWAVKNDDSIIWGYSDKYELQILDTSGHIVRRITREYDPVKITEEAKKEWVKWSYGDQGVPAGVTVNWADHHNAFHSLDVDDLGRMFVQTYEKGADGSGYYYDIFDSEGRYFAKILLKAAPRALKRDKLYSIEEDEKGFQVVKRYRVSWRGPNETAR